MHYSKLANKIGYFDDDGKLVHVSFEELYSCVKNVASKYNFEGAKRVGVCGKHSVAWLISSLVCIELGLEVVAVPENLTNEELGINLDYLDIDLFFLSQEISNKEYFQTKQLIVYDDFVNLDNPSSGEVVRDAIEFKIIAFTSGSTTSSKLKSFEFNHCSTRAFIKNFVQQYKVESHDNWVVCHSFSHIVHFEYVLGALIFGYNLTITEPIKYLLSVSEIKGDILVTVPSVYQNLLRILYGKLPESGAKREVIEALQNGAFDQEKLDLINNIRDYVYSDIKKYLGSFYKVMIIGAAPSSLELKQKLLSLGLSVFEGYGMSETNMISANTPGAYKFGSVGRVWKNIQIYLDDDQVVHVKTDPLRTNSYLSCDSYQPNDTFKDDGWVCTGDIGELDEEGFLFIKGRVKDILVSSNGKNINSNLIEGKLNAIEGVGCGLVYGHGKPFVVALIAPATSENIPTRSYVGEQILLINKSLPFHERVNNFIILDVPLTIDNGMLTRSGKPKKSYVEEIYSCQINACYK